MAMGAAINSNDMGNAVRIGGSSRDGLLALMLDTPHVREVMNAADLVSDIIPSRQHADDALDFIVGGISHHYDDPELLTEAANGGKEAKRLHHVAELFNKGFLRRLDNAQPRCGLCESIAIGDILSRLGKEQLSAFTNDLSYIMEFAEPSYTLHLLSSIYENPKKIFISNEEFATRVLNVTSYVRSLIDAHMPLRQDDATVKNMLYGQKAERGRDVYSASELLGLYQEKGTNGVVKFLEKEEAKTFISIDVAVLNHRGSAKADVIFYDRATGIVLRRKVEIDYDKELRLMAQMVGSLLTVGEQHMGALPDKEAINPVLRGHKHIRDIIGHYLK
jgi:hypothetical protein